MAKVQHLRGLNTNLDSLYNNIKQVLQERKELVQRIMIRPKSRYNSNSLRKSLLHVFQQSKYPLNLSTIQSIINSLHIVG